MSKFPTRRGMRLETEGIMKKWNIIHECDDDNGNPTCWSIEISNKDYGQFAWINEMSDGVFNIEAEIHGETSILTKCKTLVSAKRWVSTHLFL